MTDSADRAIAIVGVGAILPDAPSAAAFWQNIVNKRYSITDVPSKRWSAPTYFDPDPKAPDKTYSKIGGWVKDFEFDWKRFRIPPKVAGAMDEGQQWAVTISADALADYGYPERPLNTERTAVIFGTAMGGELHYVTNQRVVFPEFVHSLETSPEFQQLPESTRTEILSQWHKNVDKQFPQITEDTMPGELSNIVSGRVANVLNLRGPNFITDAACASSFAAVESACQLLIEHKVDAVLTGGSDHNMNVSSFVKFCKIGALSATGTRPFGSGADGFVMGEGAGVFLLKRLDDAERAGDKIYAVIRGVGGSSDGKGKGITAPNPVGQELAIRRAWESAGLDPATATLVEAHGTSTRVGDVVEVESLNKIFGAAPKHSIGLGSAKSNIGHLKAGAGAAGMLKATMALHHKILPPTLNAETPNPNIDFSNSPFQLVHEPQEWKKQNGTPRRCGVSAYGFGGTNFHLVMEEYVPGMLTNKQKKEAITAEQGGKVNGTSVAVSTQIPSTTPKPVRGILALGANNPTELKDKLDRTLARVQTGWTPQQEVPKTAVLQAPERLIIDFNDHDELKDRIQKAQKLMGFDNDKAWKAVQAQGIFRGRGKPDGKVAFLFPGQGSQYPNMGRELAEKYPIVAEVFAEADKIMTPILGKPLTDYIFVDTNDQAAMMQAQMDLMQTEITQPAMLTMDIAMLKLLDQFGFKPDMVMGHSLGEYAALIAAGIMPFAHALEAAAARGGEMSKVSWDDNGWMAAVLAPYEVVIETLNEVDGYVVPANINSRSQCVIGGASKAVEQAIKVFQDKGYRAMQLPVSHAFHTEIVAPASGPLRQVLDRLDIQPPKLPLVANLTGELYPTGVEEIKDVLQLQVASPVEWVKGLETLYANNIRTFVEVGPKRALRGFANDVFSNHNDVLALMTNHPKQGELPTFNQALCGLYAAGYGIQQSTINNQQPTGNGTQSATPNPQPPTPNPQPLLSNDIEALGQMLMQALQQSTINNQQSTINNQQRPFDRNETPLGSVIISGTGLGLPGAEKPIMDPDNALRILKGEQFIDLIPERFRQQMLNKRITRLVKSASGDGSFQTIDDPNLVIKLAGRPGSFDLTEEYGVPEKLVQALDITTQLAMAAGLDALREAGIPMVMTYKRTTTNKYLPQKWMLPEALRDETGVIFASAFPGGARFAEDFEKYYTYQNRLDQLKTLEDLRRYTQDGSTLMEINRRINELRDTLEREPYVFDRRFIFRILAMGHSQFAEYIGARGPNTHVNAACASTTQGIAIAEDWIRSGRCRRVIVIGADDVTGDHLMEWVGSGFLSLGAAATDDQVATAALPFDKRRHGTILGMGACALVVESEDAVRERGMRGIVELLSSESRNSAFHGSRLDVNHISMVMNDLVTSAERRFGLNRQAIAQQLVFMSHETFTPARGGSASAEVIALRNTFGDVASDIVVANTKGFTGHPMGVGVEDVIALKILEYGIVPPVPNYKEVDPDLGKLNLSRGGRYPVQFALHLAAGFGSQIAFSFTRRIPGSLDRTDNKPQYQKWLDDISGYDYAETEVVKRVLRVVANGSPMRRPVANQWRYGTGPVVRTAVSTPAPTTMPPAPITLPDFAPAPEPVKVPSPPPPAPKPTREPAEVRQHAPVVEEKTAVVSEKEAVSSQQSAVSSQPVENNQQSTINNQQSTIDLPSVNDEISEKVIAIVAEATGYPTDMLDLDLDLEADLGIDTVKQAETFAAIRETFEIPTRDDLNLREYNTLELVIGFVKDSRPALAESYQQSAISSQPTPISQPPTPSPQPPADEIADKVLALVAEQTGYPIDMLELDLDLEADLGIDTVKQAETFAAIRQTFDIPLRDDLNLRDYGTLELVIGFVKEMRPDLAESSQQRSNQQSAISSQPEQTQSSVISHQSSTDEVADQVLAIVAEQTGYPIDMLELDLDLEADLGIDTVKQAETFAAIRQMFDIPLRDDLNLREYNTLELVIGFVKEMRPDLAESSQQRSNQQSAISSQPEQTQSSVISHQSSTDEVADQVLAIVAEQTGYPIDMLELDLDLEADLGIDTVKQAETFAAIRQMFDIPLRDDLNLREYNTLELVIGFVKEMRPDLAESSQQSAVSSQPVGNNQQSTINNQQSTISTALSSLEDADKMPRRVPVPQLRPSLTLCKPTGVTLNENSRVIVAMDSGGIGKALVSRLEKLKVTVHTLDATLAADALIEQLNAWVADGPVSGVYWLTALDVEPALDTMTLETWREANRVRVKNLSITMRVLYDVVNEAGNFLVAATRLGGLHGYGDDGATAPLGGAVSGFTKAYKRERGDVLVKVVDFEVGRKTAVPADTLIAETLTDNGIVEVGHYQNNRYTVTIDEQPAVDGQPGLTLDQDTVFVVTGAAGGITSAIVNDLAAASGGIFYLLDLVEAPAAGDTQVQLFRSDKEALKKQLIDAAKAAGERPTPVYIEKQMMAIERQEAALSAIEAVEAAGGTAVYRSANLLDGPAITAIVDEVKDEYGRIDVLVHAGGIEISKALNQKAASQFDLVYDIKANGFFSILNAAKEMPIGATVCFSSVAGRFGNSGQTDYSAANDLLCKLTSSFRSTRPDTKGIVIDWTAWGGIGMATRGSIPKIMEMAGIEMLPPESGIPTVRRELVAGGFKGEIVVGGELGMMVAEWDETGGLDVEKVAVHLAEQKMLMVGEVTATKLYGGLQVETTLDPKAQPFLFDHAPDENTPWLPGVMATEAMAQVASALVPGYHVAAVEDEEMSGAFKFFRNEARTLHLTAIIQPIKNGELVAKTTLRSITQPTREGLPVREQEHFSANVRLQADALPQPTIEFEPPTADTMPIMLDTIYETFFHGPAYQVIERAGMEGNTAVCLMPDNMTPNTEPADAVSLMAPRLIELCFQAAALWTQEVKQAMGFPLGIGSVTAYQQPAAADGKRLYALLTTQDDGETFDAQVVDEAGNVFVDLKGYRTVSRPM